MIPEIAISAMECARYLRLLGFNRREPSLNALVELTRAHVTRVPFEMETTLTRAVNFGGTWSYCAKTGRGSHDMARMTGRIRRTSISITPGAGTGP